MGIKFGGDMDDPYNPASPFIARQDVEAEAERLLAEMDSNRDRQNAAEIAFIDQWVGTKFNDDDMPPLAIMTKWGKAAIKRMWEVRRNLQGAVQHPNNEWEITEAISLLSEMIPPGYGEENHES